MAELADKRVLVIGHRKGISATLQRLQLPFAVWHDSPMRSPPDCLATWSAAFPAKAKDATDFAGDTLAAHGPFTHVIAGTEGAVPTASVCRRALGARKTRDASALSCHDKQTMKRLMRDHDIPMTDYIAGSERMSPEQIFARLGPRVVIKQRRNSGGRGLTMARSVADVAGRRERGLLYERWVEGSELSIESFVRGGQIEFTSTTDYVVKTHANLVPSGIDPDTLDEALAVNRRVIAALGLKWGLTHAEFFRTTSGVLFGEIALRPPGGYIMDCISLAHEFDAWEAFVANELDVTYAFPSTCAGAAGSVLLHPGPGKIEAIHGVDAVRAMPSCARFKTLIRPGVEMSHREGISQVAAYGLFVSSSPKGARQELVRCIDAIRFDITTASGERRRVAGAALPPA